MISIKDGVRAQGVGTEALIAVIVAIEVWRELGEMLVITSITDGRHMVGSLHHCGCAVDFRLPGDKAQEAAKQLQNRLSREWQVILERTHIHVEYDPK